MFCYILQKYKLRVIGYWIVNDRISRGSSKSTKSRVWYEPPCRLDNLLSETAILVLNHKQQVDLRLSRMPHAKFSESTFWQKCSRNQLQVGRMTKDIFDGKEAFFKLTNKQTKWFSFHFEKRSLLSTSKCCFDLLKSMKIPLSKTFPFRYMENLEFFFFWKRTSREIHFRMLDKDKFV